MSLIIITPEQNIKDEVRVLIQLFEEGLSVLHLRKPHMDIEELRRYIHRIPAAFHNRIVLHQFHELSDEFDLRGIHLKTKDREALPLFELKNYYQSLSTHNKTLSTSLHQLEELHETADCFDYCFMSPIFSSISKKNYRPTIDWNELKKYQLDTPLFALGGINPSNIGTAMNYGFGGVAVLGYLWGGKADEILKRYRLLMQTIKKYKHEG